MPFGTQDDKVGGLENRIDSVSCRQKISNNVMMIMKSIKFRNCSVVPSFDQGKSGTIAKRKAGIKRRDAMAHCC